MMFKLISGRHTVNVNMVMIANRFKKQLFTLPNLFPHRGERDDNDNDLLVPFVNSFRTPHGKI